MLHSVILTLLFISLRVSISWGIYTWMAWLKAHFCHVQFEAYFLFKLTRHKGDGWNRPENLIFFSHKLTASIFKKINFVSINLFASTSKTEEKTKTTQFYLHEVEKNYFDLLSEPSLRLTTKLCLHNQGGRTIRLSQC